MLTAQLQPRSGLPPTYIESLNHLKEASSDSPKAYCDTPKNHQMTHHDDPVKMPFSPYGGGDGQNNFFHQEYRGMCMIEIMRLYKTKHLVN